MSDACRLRPCTAKGIALRHLRDFEHKAALASVAAGNCPEPERFAVAIRSPLPALVAGPVAQHDRGDFAQEFLRRNAAYRAAWAAFRAGQYLTDETDIVRAEAQRWGLVRLFDPDCPVRSSPAIWRADCASLVVSLAPAPGLVGAAALPDAAPAVDFVAGGGRHLVLDAGGVRHRLHVLADAPRAPLAILAPPLGDPLRVAACDAARRLFAGSSMAEPAAAMRPSALQRQRQALLLRVLDASLAGAGNREIGVRIVYPWLAGTDPISWKSMSERRRVQRLVAEARGLASVGYRDLLRRQGDIFGGAVLAAP